MATSMEVRLVTANTRVGADSRKKDNSGKVATGTEEVTRLGGGDQERDGQTAAYYLVPTGADVVGSPMSAYWTNYLRLADTYVGGNDDAFMFVSYRTQQSYNEQDIQKECDRNGEGMLNLYRESHNRAMTQFRKTKDSNDLENALEYLEDFKKEQRGDTETLPADDCDDDPEDYGKCEKCDEPRIGEYTELCADCYWSEDSYLKSMKRNAL
jgi:hypothetical protein